MSTYVDQVTLTAMTCGGCGIAFAVPETWRQERRDDHKTWYCPNGCPRVYRKGTSDLEKEQAARKTAEQRLAWACSREQAQRREKEHAQRSAAAYRGQVTRMRNKIAAGVCPVGTCRRPFVNVKAHIESQHPAWAHDHAEVLA